MITEAGRELDALVAEKVIQSGFSWDLSKFPLNDAYAHRLCKHDSLKPFCLVVPFYSTDIGAAWQVVGKLRKDGYGIIFNDTRVQYRCRFWRHDGKDAWNIFTWVGEPDTEYTIWADTAPLAICLAALKAVGHAD